MPSVFDGGLGINPNDFKIQSGYFPRTQEEREKSSEEIINLFNVKALTEDMKVQYVATLPDGRPLYLILT